MKTTLALCFFGAALVATSAPAHAGHGTDLMKFAPEASQMVIVFDVADARDSPLLQKGYQKLLDTKPDAKAKMAEIGIDPMKDVDTILIAGGSADSLDMDKVKNMVVVIEGRLPKDKLSKIPESKTSTYAGVTIIATKDSEAAMIGDRLFFTKAGQMKGEIDIVQGKGKGKNHNLAVSSKGKALRDAVAATDTTADMWATVIVPAAKQKSMQGVIAKTVSFGVNFTADVAAMIKVGTDSEASAAKTVTMAQAQLGQAVQGLTQFGLGAAAKSLTVAQDAKDKAFVTISVKVTEAEITSIMALAQQFGGGMGGSKPPATSPTAPMGTKPH
jgi:hypothetical protein